MLKSLIEYLNKSNLLRIGTFLKQDYISSQAENHFLIIVI